MTDTDYARKLEELDRLLNDPTVPMVPDRIWALLADIARHDGRALGASDPVGLTLGLTAN
jgi:hypothetical protein